MKNKKEQLSHAHEFAFFYADLSVLEVSQVILDDEDLFHRFKHVVRMQQGDRCILFDKAEHGTFIFEKFEGKNKVIGFLEKKVVNTVLAPHITFLLPLLKVDALTDALYSCAEVGITTVQLLITAKTQTPYSVKLHDKLARVAIAAAEQSKNFAVPTILPPIKLTDWITHQHEGHKFYFDVGGVPFSQWYQPVQNNQSYYILVGPEGDLTPEEKLLVRQTGFQICALTCTVLRSIRAINLVSGIFRL